MKSRSGAKTLRGLLARSALLLSLRATVALEAEGASRPEWTTASPEEVGFDSASLVEMFDDVRQHDVHVHSAQIVRHGKLVLDAYFYPYSADMRHDVASVTKSITSTLIGLAIEKGYLRDVNQPVLSFFAGRSAAQLDDRKHRLTLENLLTMQAGWDCGFEPKEARLLEMRTLFHQLAVQRARRLQR